MLKKPHLFVINLNAFEVNIFQFKEKLRQRTASGTDFNADFLRGFSVKNPTILRETLSSVRKCWPRDFFNVSIVRQKYPDPSIPPFIVLLSLLIFEGNHAAKASHRYFDRRYKWNRTRADHQNFYRRTHARHVHAGDVSDLIK